MKSIAIITARGGSKRIPRKNIKEFCGKPIIVYSIQAALESGAFDEVMVSTDDEEIAQISIKYGANVPFFRSKQNANDFATTADVIQEVIQEYEKRDKSFDVICCMYPTAPFITANKLQKAMNVLVTSKADCVLPVVAYSFPPQRGMRIDDKGYMYFVEPEYMNTRSQDLPKIYHDCGQFYMFRAESFVKTGRITTEKTIPFEVSELEVQDIDNEVDWKLAELKYQCMEVKGNENE